MDESGRRTRWGTQIKQLFGNEFYDHVIYYDVVGCSFKNSLQFIVITDLHLYIYDLNAKVVPEPFCKLWDIMEIDSDHETPETFRLYPEYKPHRIIICVDGLYHALYTFETGTDLYWRLSNSVENAKRHKIVQRDSGTKEPDEIRLITIDGKEISLHNYYVQKFNKIASHVIHETVHESRMKAMAELEEISNQYFAIRIIFFQSSYLVQYLMDTLSFLSDYHSVPPQITSSRVQQVQLIKTILDTFQFYLRGSASVHDALRLISFNSGEHFKTLLRSCFKVEYFIISQPKRTSFFITKNTNQEKYMTELQAVEMAVPSLCYHLYGLSNISVRKMSNTAQTLFQAIITEEADDIIRGALHTIAFMTVQLGYLLKETQVNDIIAYTFHDHIWFVDYMCTKFPAAALMVKNEFEVELNFILTEERVSKETFQHFLLYEELIKVLRHLKQVLKQTVQPRGLMQNLPVQFR
ncbi:hypothetical protein TVAG_182470 [Trichomonas vaginalis G3]|uniref:Uncharacterized protein n=1 Tax=Trichomonas vaginalis (strain ATCC PRA-98 / G3) TaxID=412133 RepID=A2D8Y5_TRIV3|nr:protein of unknown function, DUF4551 family [Trichomonas vaginalis G3]EAY23011.1 hypothetical protein TVAG_182470 [Trichomonas vaginalis G3]KAI5518970.1 protein of unknown function, DUF4551 family [Trichomonas vaginalis G3]|eukprot:XP_001583997.1 hypothetical protein [Trichomonas vaginalis G3]